MEIVLAIFTGFSIVFIFGALVWMIANLTYERPWIIMIGLLIILWAAISYMAYCSGR